MKYTLELDEAQADVLRTALDLYVRVGIGQLERVADVIDDHPDITPDQIHAIKAHLNDAKAVLGFVPGASHSLRNGVIPDRFRVAYDIQQVVDAQRHLDRAIDHDTPGVVRVVHRTSIAVALPIFEPKRRNPGG